MKSVEAVVVNFRRPQNVGLILTQLRRQSHKCRITLVDAADAGNCLTDDALAKADRVYRLGYNYGAWNRYVPVGAYDCEFTYFHDDDMLPGTRIIEHFVRAAELRPDAALLGQMGRVIRDRYRGIDLRRTGNEFVPCDMVVRGYFVRTEHLPNVLRLKQRLGQPAHRVDDMVLALSIQAYGCGSILLTPKSPDPQEDMGIQELPDQHALCRERGHYAERNRFWFSAMKLVSEIKSQQQLGALEHKQTPVV